MRLPIMIGEMSSAGNAARIRRNGSPSCENGGGWNPVLHAASLACVIVIRQAAVASSNTGAPDEPRCVAVTYCTTSGVGILDGVFCIAACGRPPGCWMMLAAVAAGRRAHDVGGNPAPSRRIVVQLHNSHIRRLVRVWKMPPSFWRNSLHGLC